MLCLQQQQWNEAQRCMMQQEMVPLLLLLGCRTAGLCEALG